MSPCLSLCSHDDGRCRGCYRTTDEIREWKKITPGRKAAIWTRILLTSFYGIKALYCIIVFSIGISMVGFFLCCLYVGKFVNTMYRKLARRFRLE